MSDIKTWIERCDEHPDHQSGMISDGMIRARMCEEIDDLRAEIERLKQEPELLRAELISLSNAARNALADAYDRARDARWKASHERARNAMEGKP